jgi:di/tricarboxylate transporter
MSESLVLAQEVTTQPALTTDIFVLLAPVLFITERLPIDVTAILLIVVLVVLEPWTGVDPSTGISGFSNAATITVLAMLILSGGIARTGLVQKLGRRMAAYAGDSIRKQLFATVLGRVPLLAFSITRRSSRCSSQSSPTSLIGGTLHSRSC